MEQVSDNYEPADNNQRTHPLTALAFLRIGLIEFGFVTIVLFLLFGILNYFNILSVSDVFPNQLSWLPRKEVPTGTSQTKNISKNNPINYSPVSSPTPQGPFQYDTKKAEILLAQYIKDNIKPEFIPAKIEIKEGLTIDGRMEDVKYQFGFSSTNPTETISASFHYKENTNQQNDFSIFIQPKTVDSTTATISLANSLLSSYFTNPFSISNCQTKNTTSYCENFQTLTEGKKGYGIVFLYQGTKLIPLVFNCIVPKENKDYDIRNSCLSL